MIKNISENFNRLSWVHERYRQTTDRRTDDDSEREREFAFDKNILISLLIYDAEAQLGFPRKISWFTHKLRSFK